jgi:membrane protein DedA with SNARE-associated domain
MPPLAFLFFNAAGSMVWATAYGLAAYAAGSALLSLRGWLAAGFGLAAAAIVVAGLLLLRRHSTRLEARAEAASPGPMAGYPGGLPL